MDFVAAALTAMAIVVAWIVFRFERHAARRRDVAGARAVLTAVQRGMIEGMPELGPEYVGWGEIYFTNQYDRRTALLRGNEAYTAIKNHAWDQVFVVPTEPLALLATTSSDLVSEETIFVANFALWRVRVFNQLVEAQSAFNARYATEIMDKDITADRQHVLGVTAREVSQALHEDGIGLAGSAAGWYGRLKAAVASDVAKLEKLEAGGLFSYAEGERYLRTGDVLATALTVAVLGVAGYFVAEAVAGEDDAPANARPVPTHAATASSGSSGGATAPIGSLPRSTRTASGRSAP